MTPEDAEYLRQLVQARAGVAINPANTYQIESRLGPVARGLSAASTDQLLASLRETRDEKAVWAVIEAMVSSETWFFRDMEPFVALTDTILPALQRTRQRPIRIWSAACAHGQEAYSIAMALAAEAKGRPSAAPRVELYASDISETCVRKAEAGIYTAFEVQRGLPIRSLLEHFKKDGENWRVRPHLSQSVRWRRINLMSDLSPLGAMDVIFCRNTLSLFDKGVRAKVLENLASVLADDGYLMLGVRETADDFPGFYAVEDVPGLFCRAPGRQAAAA